MVRNEMREGDVVRSLWDDKAYTITKIAKSMVVLKSKEGERSLITEIDSLKIFYKPIE